MCRFTHAYSQVHTCIHAYMYIRPYSHKVGNKTLRRGLQLKSQAESSLASGAHGGARGDQFFAPCGHLQDCRVTAWESLQSFFMFVSLYFSFWPSLLMLHLFAHGLQWKCARVDWSHFLIWTCTCKSAAIL